MSIQICNETTPLVTTVTIADDPSSSLGPRTMQQGAVLDAETMKELKFKNKLAKKQIDIPKGAVILAISELAVGVILYYTAGESGTMFLQIAAVDVAEKTLKRMAKKTKPWISLLSLGTTLLAGYITGATLGKYIITWASVKMATSASIAAIVNRVIYKSNGKPYQPFLDRLVQELATGELRGFGREEIEKAVDEEIQEAFETETKRIRKGVVGQLKGTSIAPQTRAETLRSKVAETVLAKPISIDEEGIKKRAAHRILGNEINELALQRVYESV